MTLGRIVSESGRRADRVASVLSRATVLVAIATAVTLYLATDPDNADSLGLNIALGTIVALLFFGLYDVTVWGLARAARSSGLAAAIERRLPQKGTPKSLGKGHGIGARGAIVVFSWYVVGLSAPWVIIGFKNASETADQLRQILVQAAPLAVPASVLIAGGLVWILTARYTKELPSTEIAASLGLRPTPKIWALRGIVGGFAIAIVYLIVGPLVSPPPEPSSQALLSRMAATPGAARAVWAFTGVAMAPLFEEFVFRGVLYEGFRRSWGIRWSAIITTILFTSLHVPEVGLYWPGLTAIATMGGAAAYLRIRTGSIAPPAALHLAYNGVLVTLVYLASRGNAV